MAEVIRTGQRSLTWDEAQTARRRYYSGNATIEGLAREYDVALATMQALIAGMTYKTVSQERRNFSDVVDDRDGVVARNGVYHGNGKSLDWWLKQRGCDQRDINRITARRFWYGSYRPSDRAALMLDSSPTLTPYADEPLAAD